MNERQGKDLLEERREKYLKRIKEGISHINYRIKERTKEEKDIRHLEEKLQKLTDYKKKIENAQDQPELLKVWLNILENRSSGLPESIYYELSSFHMTLSQNRIKYEPEKSDHYRMLGERYKKLKEMLIEGRDWLSVQGKLMEPLNKP